MPRILLVEDDTDIRNLYSAVLEKRGFEVVAAQDGREGLEYMQSETFDGILLDLMMPHVDGLEFLRRLKSNPPEHALPPILVLSNLAYAEAETEALELGAQKFLVKADLDPKQVVDMAIQMIEETTSS